MPQKSRLHTSRTEHKQEAGNMANTLIATAILWQIGSKSREHSEIAEKGEEQQDMNQD